MSESNKSLVKKKPVLYQAWLLNLYLYLAFKMSDYRDRLIEALKVLQKGLAAETDQTKEMLQIYIRQSQGDATRTDVKRANKQLRDLIRSMGLGVLVLLPFSPITLPLLVRLGRRLGVEILPDSFKDLM